MATTLIIGRYVKVHSLASEKAKQHNGKTAIVTTPLNEGTGRYGITPIGQQQSAKILSIKPTNLTILCSFCKMREEKIACQRCMKESYCSEDCKKKHWEGVNKESDVPNCHEIWCVPLQLEMECPIESIGDSNIGDDAYNNVVRYLNLAMEIGDSGRRNEEKVMLEKLIDVDPLQPSAYNNLFVCCRQLAIHAERYKPDEYEELAYKAIQYLTRGIELNTSDEVEGFKAALDNPLKQMAEAYINTIEKAGVSFVEACMQGERGKGNAKLENIESCLKGMLVLYHQNNEPSYNVQMSLGYCLQKLMKYEEAIDNFTQVAAVTSETPTSAVSSGEGSKKKKKNKSKKGGNTPQYLASKEWLHQSMMQLGQCYQSLALYSDEKPASERVEIINMAIAKFEEAIEQFKKDRGCTNSIPEFVGQYHLSKCFYNKNSLLCQLSSAMKGEMEYPPQLKAQVQLLMSETANAALQGAMKAGDMKYAQDINQIQNLPFH